MGFIQNLFNNFFGIPKSCCKQGPNTLSELLDQFSLPAKEKNEQDVIRDYSVFIAMANLEVEMLRMEPSKAFRGVQVWIDGQGNKFVDWVPCVVRPEVVYCSYGKN